ncbi:MAG: EAL domain-containing protein, partial [Treponema sp.]|nr:EAL domain-containing protein [Treponema sp.]
HACNDEGIGVSGGITIFPDDSRKPSDLLKFADMAMVEVKKNGKNSIYFFQKMMEEKFLKKICIENKLTKALSEDLFMLYFQPQFDVLTGKLRGFEALLRWHDDELGWIRPDQFIPLAEETQLVIPLGEWVMETAIKTLARWEKDFNFSGIISVNVSPLQFKKDDFIYNLKDKINHHGIKVEHLEIEITEGMFIDNMPDTVAKLNEIRSMGIGISLDDFGTGYSSLRYLQILPLTTLKIDKSFISNISEANGVEANITESIVSLVSKMGLDTIAEGVETDSQLDMLKKFNCHNVQGFLKGKPMPVDLCERMLNGDTSAILTIKNITPESQ